MSDWQSIGTAPKDGTPVLAYGPTMEPSIYVLRYEQWLMDDRDALGNTIRKVFMEHWCEAGGERNERFEPTLWMPLDALLTAAAEVVG